MTKKEKKGQDAEADIARHLASVRSPVGRWLLQIAQTLNNAGCGQLQKTFGIDVPILLAKTEPAYASNHLLLSLHVEPTVPSYALVPLERATFTFPARVNRWFRSCRNASEMIAERSLSWFLKLKLADLAVRFSIMFGTTWQQPMSTLS